MINWGKPKVYAVKHNNLDIRMLSRSGGIFTALSDTVLNRNGIIYGCVLTGDFLAVHLRAESPEERNLMRGSKYIQSSMGEMFKAVETDLKSGKEVLFSGTSCQISGLNAFLGKDYERLISIDVVCHGVPSPKVWKEYLIWQEDVNDAKCTTVDFRNKKDHGWEAHIETLTMTDQTGKQLEVHSEVFKNLFYGHNILRPACYKCPYKSVMHPGDITIADYWGIEKAAPGFSDNRGVSLVLINNERASDMFDTVKDCIDYQECLIEDSMQPPLIKPFEKPKEREQFWRDFYSVSFNKIAKKYGGIGLMAHVKKVIGKAKRKVMQISFRLTGVFAK
ncbi:MAG: Coenzyme F420 hydrogenase/dehydrogenase, beta subunit C-terminal domain [Lachnospiraceae bacterium]